VKEIINRSKNFLLPNIKGAYTALDSRDFFVFGGLSMAGYGLYQVYPALSFIVCGSFLVCLGMGFFVRRPVK
jgi:hypothetical protein